MKRATCVKVALSMMVAVAATFGGGPAFAQGKVIKMIPGGDLKIIDPIQNASYISRNHGYMVYDTLFAVDSKGQVKPQMIDTWTLSARQEEVHVHAARGAEVARRRAGHGGRLRRVDQALGGEGRVRHAADARARVARRGQRAHLHADAEGSRSGW